MIGCDICDAPGGIPERYRERYCIECGLNLQGHLWCEHPHLPGKTKCSGFTEFIPQEVI